MQTKVVTIPIHVGLNSGVDSKLLQKGLTISKNCLVNKFGSIVKRPGIGPQSFLSSEGVNRIHSNGDIGFFHYQNAVLESSALCGILNDQTVTYGDFQTSPMNLKKCGFYLKPRSEWLVTESTAMDWCEFIDYESSPGMPTGFQSMLYKKGGVNRLLHTRYGLYYQQDTLSNAGQRKLVGMGGKIYSVYNNAGSLTVNSHITTSSTICATGLLSTCVIDVDQARYTSASTYYYGAFGAFINSSKQLVAFNLRSKTSGATCYLSTAITASATNGFSRFVSVWNSNSNGVAGVLTHNDADNKIVFTEFNNTGKAQAPTKTVDKAAIYTGNANITACGYCDGSYHYILISYISADGIPVNSYKRIPIGSSTVEYTQAGVGLWPVTKPSPDNGHFVAKICPYNAGSTAPLDDFGYFIVPMSPGFSPAKVFHDEVYFNHQNHYKYRPTSFRGNTFVVPTRTTDGLSYQVKCAEVGTDRDFSDASSGKMIILSGGIPHVIDQVSGGGQSIADANFNEYPYSIKLNPATTETASTSNQWNYAALWKFQYGDGRVAYSRPSPIATRYQVASTVGVCTVSIGVPSLFARYSSPIFLQVYRTNKNSSVLRFMTERKITSDQVVTWTDSGTADSDTREPVLDFSGYGNGSILPYDSPPLGRASCIAFGRFFSASDTKPGRIYYSQVINQEDSLKFSEDPDLGLFFDIPDYGGDVVSMIQMDDKLIILKENAIYATYGEGRGETGEGGQYATVYLVSNAIGCRDRLSSVRIPNGVVFMSASGLKLLTRSLEIEHIGEPVRHFILDASGAPTVLRAFSWPEKDAVLWATDTGLVVYYNYKFNFWSHWTSKNATGGQPRYINSVAGEIFVSLDGGVARFNEAYYSDKKPLISATAIEQSIATGWMSLNDIGGRVRARHVNVLADKLATTTCHLVLGSQYDMVNRWYDSTVTVVSRLVDDRFYTVAGSESVTAFNSFHLSLPRQKCSAIRLKLVENSTKQGFAIQAISMDVGVMDGIREAKKDFG